MTDDIEVHVPSRNVHSTGGRESYRAAVRARLAEVPDRKMRVVAMAATADTMFIESFWEGTSSGEQAALGALPLGPKGTPVSRRTVVVLRFVDGRAASDHTYA